MTRAYNLKGKIWLYSGKSSWHFLTISTKTAENIDFYFAHEKRGWGSLPVMVTIGETTWRTSIFTDKKNNSYILPLKADVRKKENLKARDMVSFSILIDPQL